MRYAEDELDDYTNERRVMSELAGVTHMLDTASARVFHNYPKAQGDEWPGASQVNFNS